MAIHGVAPVMFGSVSMVTATLGDNDPEVGTTRESGGVRYRFVYNNGTSQISPGYGATVSGLVGYSCTVSTTTGTDFLVGVCRHATLTTGTYGWLATKGFVPVQMGAGDSCAAGGLLTPAVDGAFANKTISTGYPGILVGKAMSAIASNTSGYALIDLD